MDRDERTGEIFLRVVGRRTAPPLGEPPPLESRDALATMARYRTRAPKGIFVYRSHAEMEADRLRWTVDAMIERARRG
ncbi:hypothetical protein WME98_52625 [Sorangium sp. So ce296]|uniref:hypothetical protein n=1 Tax=Sorangium sp. So ce296 TaxID=3133296 RepID=UPI003F6398BB